MPLDLIARFHQLTEEIDQLRLELGRKIDEAAELMTRISLVDATSSHSGSRLAGQDPLAPQSRQPRPAPPTIL